MTWDSNGLYSLKSIKKIDFRQTKVHYGSLSGRKSRARQKISHLGQDSSGHLLLFHVAELDASRVLHLS